MSTEGFAYDVFLCHSAKNKAVVHPLEERLRLDGLKAPPHFGFRHLDFGFAQPGTLRFRDPLKQEPHSSSLAWDPNRHALKAIP